MCIDIVIRKEMAGIRIKHSQAIQYKDKHLLGATGGNHSFTAMIKRKMLRHCNVKLHSLYSIVQGWGNYNLF